MALMDIQKNFTQIIRTLEGQGMKPTNIAKSIGYTTTSQLNSTINGESLLSTKAIIGLVEKLNVNPIYLLLGKGEMFLTDDSEIDRLRKENQELIQKHNEAIKTALELNEIIKKLEKRNADLIDMSAAALKYYKESKEPSDLKSLFGDDPIKANIEFMKIYSKLLKKDEVETIEEKDSGSSLKRNK
ncbi:MAG: hypothetical protein JW973_07125 [Bacteroidales bacterium]|nr:hypothetical protein [Bacteroidales bacterium]